MLRNLLCKLSMQNQRLYCISSATQFLYLQGRHFKNKGTFILDPIFKFEYLYLDLISNTKNAEASAGKCHILQKFRQICELDNIFMTVLFFEQATVALQLFWGNLYESSSFFLHVEYACFIVIYGQGKAKKIFQLFPHPENLLGSGNPGLAQIQFLCHVALPTTYKQLVYFNIYNFIFVQIFADQLNYSIPDLENIVR